MADIKLIYDKDRIRLKDLRALQSSDIEAWIETLARFASYGDGEYIPHETAVVEVEDLSLTDVQKAVGAFLAAAKEETSPK